MVRRRERLTPLWWECGNPRGPQGVSVTAFPFLLPPFIAYIRRGELVRVRAWGIERVYTAVMGLARHRIRTRFGVKSRASTTTPNLGPWGVYGEAIGNPKFYVGTNPKDSEFLQAADEFASAHEDVLRELAKH